MLYAINEDGDRMVPSSAGKCFCPSCDSELIRKMGSQVIHHFSHKAKDCDTWSEGLTPWHLDWQEKAPIECREVTMKQGETLHRADIRNRSNFVLEIQHSSISAKAIQEREDFYGEMAWVFDVRDQVERCDFMLRRSCRGFHSFGFGVNISNFLSKPILSDLSDLEFNGLPLNHVCIHRKTRLVDHARYYRLGLEKDKPSKDQVFVQADTGRRLSSLPSSGGPFWGSRSFDDPVLGTCQSVVLQWKRHKKSWASATKPAFLDFGAKDWLLLVNFRLDLNCLDHQLFYALVVSKTKVESLATTGSISHQSVANFLDVEAHSADGPTLAEVRAEKEKLTETIDSLDEYSDAYFIRSVCNEIFAFDDAVQKVEKANGISLAVRLLQTENWLTQQFKEFEPILEHIYMQQNPGSWRLNVSDLLGKWKSLEQAAYIQFTKGDSDKEKAWHSRVSSVLLSSKDTPMKTLLENHQKWRALSNDRGDPVAETIARLRTGLTASVLAHSLPDLYSSGAIREDLKRSLEQAIACYRENEFLLPYRHALHHSQVLLHAPAIKLSGLRGRWETS